MKKVSHFFMHAFNHNDIKKQSPKQLNNSKLIEPTNPTMIIKTVMQNSAIQSSLNQPIQQTNRQTDRHSMDLPRVLVVVASTKCKRRVNPIP